MAASKNPVAIKGAAELCAALRRSGTGENKLEFIRQLLMTKPNATAEEAIQALEAGKPHVRRETIEKATSLMLTGKYEPRLGEQTPVPVEELIIAGQYQAPAEALNPEMVTVRRAEFEARIAEIRKQVEGETIAKLRAEADEAEKARAQKIRDEILAEMRANQSAQPPADPPTEAAGQKADDKGGKQSGKAGK
jgi:hypothetical protein